MTYNTFMILESQLTVAVCFNGKSSQLRYELSKNAAFVKLPSASHIKYSFCM